MAEEEQRILLTQAAPGMVLSRPVTLPNKVTLCGRGLVLHDSLIHKLMGLGIKRIHVKGRPLPAVNKEGFGERLQRLRRSFSRVRHIHHMQLLEAAIEKRVVRRS